MADTPPTNASPREPPESQGGQSAANLTAGSNIAVGGDVVGRDRISQVIHAETVIIGGAAAPPVTDEAPAPGESPFKGLQYFDEADAALFFGRELLVAKLVGQLREHRFLAVIVGASGSGKSSIVRAGVVPALRRAPGRWLTAAGRQPPLADSRHHAHQPPARSPRRQPHPRLRIRHRNRDPD